MVTTRTAGLKSVSFAAPTKLAMEIEREAARLRMSKSALLGKVFADWKEWRDLLKECRDALRDNGFVDDEPGSLLARVNERLGGAA